MSESPLTLIFEERSSVELVSTRFVSPMGGVLRESVRGKTPGAHGRGTGTFQWTSAVQALSVFLLRGSAQNRLGRTALFLGDADTPAASLDFALGKAPSWICEMFGSYADGTPVARKLFIRTNPERRRAGPVAIGLNESILQPAAIRVVCNAVELTTPSELLALAERIERVWSARGRAAKAASPRTGADLAPRYHDAGYFQGLNDAFAAELHTALTASDIFTIGRTDSMLRRMKADLKTGGFGINPRRFFGDDRLALSAGERLGTVLALDVLRKKIAPERPLSIALAVGYAGTSALFWYLKHFKGIPIRLEFEFAYAIEIKHWIATHRFAEPPDLCAIGIAPAASMLLGRKFREYQPLMILPAMTHRIVSQRGFPGRRSGDWCMLDREVSTSRMYFDQLAESGAIKRRSSKVLDADPDRVFELLHTQDEAPNAILFFPHWHIAAAYNPSKLDLSAACGTAELKEHVLFAHERLASDQALLRAIAVAVRHAWMRLRLSPALQRQVIHSMLSDPSYANALSRMSGLSSLEYRQGVHPS